MFLELIGTIFAGLGAAGVVLLINIVTRGLLPKWAMPVAAGGAMIAMSIFLEMTWANRTAETLPEGVVVAETLSETAWWRPWTYVWPQATRMMAVDTDTVRTNPDAPGTRLVDLYLFARWQPPARVAQLIDCEAKARADVTDAALADPGAADWLLLGDDNDLAEITCKE